MFGSRQETVDKALASLKEENPAWEVRGACLNLCNADAVTEEINKIKEAFGRIDILVNNAGISDSTPIDSYTSERFDQVMQLNVNAVAPGITKTDMVAALPDEVIQPMINAIPLRRIGESEDIANAFLYLASDLASYVTGEILSVDGAMRA